MTEIFLLIPDEALRDAVAEQIAAARLGAVRAVTALPAEEDAVVVADAGAFTPRAGGGPVVLLLGGADETSAAENFAKPFRLGHLMTRLRYYLETAPLLRAKPAGFGRFRLEPHNRRAVDETSGETVRLTEKETALLAFLAAKEAGASRRDILAEVWGYDERIDTHTLETHLYQLRRKLGGEGWLHSENGLYRLARGRV